MEDRQRKSRRFAGAGLGDAQHVAALEQLGNSLSLNWRRRRVIPCDKRKVDRIGQAEFRESLDSHFRYFLMRRASGAASLMRPSPAFRLFRARPERLVFFIVDPGTWRRLVALRAIAGQCVRVT